MADRAYIQRAHNYPGNTVQLTSVVASSFLWVGTCGTGGTPSSCTDDRSSTWIRKCIGTTLAGAVWTLYNAPSGTINITVTNLSDCGCTATEISGADSSDPVSSTAQDDTLATTAGDNTVTITGPGDGGALIHYWGNHTSGGDSYVAFRPATGSGITTTGRGHDTGAYDADGESVGTLGTGSISAGINQSAGANNIYGTYFVVAITAPNGGGGGGAVIPVFIHHYKQQGAA